MALLIAAGVFLAMLLPALRAQRRVREEALRCPPVYGRIVAKRMLSFPSGAMRTLDVLAYGSVCSFDVPDGHVWQAADEGERVRLWVARNTVVAMEAIRPGARVIDLRKRRH